MISSSSQADEQSPTHLVISKFPKDAELPLDLYPFHQKLKMVEIAQKRNERRFYDDQKLFHKLGIEHRYLKELRQQLRAEAKVEHNSLNEQKVKFWRHLIEKNTGSAAKLIQRDKERRRRIRQSLEVKAGPYGEDDLDPGGQESKLHFEGSDSLYRQIDRC